MTLGHLSNLLNKKLFSDDFDSKSISSWQKPSHAPKKTAEIVEAERISEDTENENENDYLSDSSSSS